VPVKHVEGSKVIEAKTIDDIDNALEKGPVFVEFGAIWCGYCTDQLPIVEELSKEYEDVTFFYVDYDKNKELVQAFKVQPIPHMNMIVKKNPDGSYLYIDNDGKATDNRQNSRILGLHQKPALVKILDKAISSR
jgi:thiol-disulfide isomerase/thioredoxin